MCSTKKKLFLNRVPIDIGCSCTRPSLSSIFNPKPNTKMSQHQKHTHFSHSSSSSSTPRDKAVNFSSPCDTSSSSSSSDTSNPKGLGRVGSKSVAVEKDSTDPYLDFRQSMLQMIDENQICSKDDLKELLNCFLQVNAPSLHGLIIRVFTEIWNAFFFSGRPNFSSSRVLARPKSYQI